MEVNILKNDMESMRKNFGILSAELVILKDFIQHQFGSQYQDFCMTRNNPLHNSQSQQLPPSMVPGCVSFKRELPETIRIPGSSRKRSRTSNRVQRSEIDSTYDYNGDDSSESLSDGDDPFATLHGIEHESAVVESEDGNGTGNEFDPISYEDDEEEIETSLTMHKPPKRPTTSSGGSEPGVKANQSKSGRRKGIIYKFFEKPNEDDSRLKCPRCRNLVSCRADRLKAHVLKCRGDDPQIAAIKKQLTIKAHSKKKTDPVHLSFESIRNSVGLVVRKKCLICRKLVENDFKKMKLHTSICHDGGEDKDLPVGIEAHVNCNPNPTSNDSMNNYVSDNPLSTFFIEPDSAVSVQQNSNLAERTHD